MSSEDLTAPLGMGKRRLVRLPFGLIGVGILSVIFTTTLIWILVVDDPLGGEPVAVLPLDAVVEGVTSQDIEVVEIRPGIGDNLGPNLRPESADDLLGPRYDMVNRPDGLGPEAPVTSLSINPDSRVSERSDYGFLPKISDAGVRPLDAYSRPIVREFTSIPKIAVIVTGLGLSEAGTQNAISSLPPDVTFALAPYGEDLDLWMQQARTKGHELLLQVPLEPFDFPDNDPGPHTLLVSLRPTEMLDRLAFLLTRATNYVGTIPEMGARFTSTKPSMEYLVEKLKERGLMLVDNGTSSRSIAAEIAADKRIPFSGVDVVLDEVPRADSIDAKLLQLEGVARSRGVAVAAGSALPVTVRQLEKWVQDLEDRGLQLVPVSATIDR
ncbi:divergent polysaccharide deacetylase family protein [Roseibium sediminicola]|uniref:Divergent polysaccharide deacetylase family protein n=1 Tax=Roseibium sediminicola TaxID=2933272 RepID=A0ABT0GW60_9HYPH|nr:divergent polysaccharide deacetylase family protein [Roseibium sp. CAU 1639]MCK7613688.1 divergent polysaccharide deacetylase family protein [Roseibium sp. CAU 1639]